MPKPRSQKSENLLRKIKDKETQLFDLLAHYHLSFLGNNNPSDGQLKHTINLISHIFVKASIVMAAPLGKREKQYIELAARGYSLKEIARLLGIAVPTAKATRDKLLQEFFCKNITEAIALFRKYDPV